MNDKEDNTELSLNDEIRAAMEESSGEESSTEKPRDESGKFTTKYGESEVDAAARLEPKAKTPPTEEAPVEPAAGGEDQQLLTEDKAPRGWSPAAREKWTSIPDDLRKEILRREEASVLGVRQMQEKFAPAENFIRSLEPILNESRGIGVAPEQYMMALASSERLLRTADLPSKFNELLRIADQYGIPLRDIVNQSVGQQVLAAPQNRQTAVPTEVQRELNEMRQWREQFENNNVTAEITRFSADKEFFEDVRLKMATFIETGAETTLQAAYDAACWATPAVREVLLARTGQQKQGDYLKARQTAAAGASTKPSGTVDVKVSDDDEDDLASTIRKEYARSATGRV